MAVEPQLVGHEPVSETFRGGTANIAGTLVPQLHFVLDGGGGVFFEHHTLLWKDAQLQIGLKKLPGGIKRKIAGMDFFLTLTSARERSPSRWTRRARADPLTSTPARRCSSASTSSWRRRTTSTTRSSGCKGCAA